jgi:hypothetical protein
MTPISQSVLDSLPDIADNALNKVSSALQDKAKIKDFYQVGLFLYCEGEKDAATGKEKVTYCSDWKLPFYFDPTDVWQLKNTSAQEILGEKYEKGMQAYGKAVRWMDWVFVITLALTAIEFVVGISAIFSRWGSLITTIVSAVGCSFPLFIRLLMNTVRRKPSLPLWPLQQRLASTLR